MDGLKELDIFCYLGDVKFLKTLEYLHYFSFSSRHSYAGPTSSASKARPRFSDQLSESKFSQRRLDQPSESLRRPATDSLQF